MEITIDTNRCLSFEICELPEDDLKNGESKIDLRQTTFNSHVCPVDAINIKIKEKQND